MADLKSTTAANVETINAELKAGLKSCKSVLTNYRAMIAGSSDIPLTAAPPTGPGPEIPETE